MENLDRLIIELCKYPNETPWIEFKHNNYEPFMIGCDISALANSAALAEKSCSYMLWGIDDVTHEIVGTDHSLQTLKKGSEEVFNIINRPQRKFEPSIMVAGGVCSYGLSNLIFLDGTENEFSYAQILFYFKDDIERLKSGNNIIYFEQDGATPHTTESNINLIKRLFGQDSLIQNPPNSPDLAYPIENLWAYIKPRIKKRNPKTLDELKKYTLEEWNNIPKK